MHLRQSPMVFVWYITRFLCLVFIWLRVSHLHLNQPQVGPPILLLFWMSLSLESPFVSTVPLKQHPLTSSGGYFHTELLFSLQKHPCRYGWGWVSLCVCGGQPHDQASNSTQAETKTTACRGCTDRAVPAGEHGVVRHGHRSLLHLPSLPNWICE